MFGKEYLRQLILLVVVCVLLWLPLSGCQSAARSLGGTVTIKLEPNVKLEEITWKDDSSLWYLTRPMTADDIAETHIFKESSEFGVVEGKVIIIESRE